MALGSALPRGPALAARRARADEDLRGRNRPALWQRSLQRRSLQRGPAQRSLRRGRTPGLYGSAGGCRSGVEVPTVTTMSAWIEGSVAATAVTPKIASSRAMLSAYVVRAPL